MGRTFFMARRLLLVPLSMLALTCVLFIQAGEPTPLPPRTTSDQASTQIKDKLSLGEQILLRQFMEFQKSLLELKQRL